MPKISYSGPGVGFLDDRYLQIANDLSDLNNAATARTNLGLVAGGAGDIWVEKAGDAMTGPLAMGANNITMTGSLAATAARVTKGWFTDVESTNMYTVGGTSIQTTFDSRYLQITNDLSDLNDAATARTNLGLVAGGAGDIWVEKGGDIITGNQVFNDNVKLFFGTGSDASILYNNTDLVIDPNEVGTGKVLIEPTTDATSIFQVNQADTTNVFNVDTTNKEVEVFDYLVIGNSAALGANAFAGDGHLTINAPAVASGRERLLYASVSDSANFFTILNTTSTNSLFIPTFAASNTENTWPAIFFDGKVDDSSGTNPALFFRGVQSDSTTALANRPIVGFGGGANGNTIKFLLWHDGRVAIGNNLGISVSNPSRPNAQLEVVGYADIVQLIAKAHSTQNANIFEARDSSANVGFAIRGDFSVIIGKGEAAKDYILQFNGENNDGTLIWREDEDYFEFSDAIKLPAGTTALAPLMFTAGTALTSPLAGALEFHGDRLYLTNVAVRRAIDRTSDAIVATTTVANTTVESTLWTGTLGANALKVGNLLKIHVNGIISNATAADDITMNIYIGTDLLATFNPAIGNVTAAHWHLDEEITVRTTGATGTLAHHGAMHIAASEDASIGLVASIDTTAAQNITVTVVWDAAKAGNTISIYTGFLEFKN